MKKARKGFTLVELLIVVAILGVLSASMMITIPGTTAKAKANAIKANLETCRTAAVIYYAKHLEDSTKPLASTSGVDALADTMSEWSSGKMTKGGVEYEVTGDEPKDWKVTATYTSDNDAATITTLLNNVNGIKATTTTDGNAASKAELTLIPGLE